MYNSTQYGLLKRYQFITHFFDKCYLVSGHYSPVFTTPASTQLARRLAQLRFATVHTAAH